jgi:hypothetical protein
MVGLQPTAGSHRDPKSGPQQGARHRVLPAAISLGTLRSAHRRFETPFGCPARRERLNMRIQASRHAGQVSGAESGRLQTECQSTGAARISVRNCIVQSLVLMPPSTRMTGSPDHSPPRSACIASRRSRVCSRLFECQKYHTRDGQDESKEQGRRLAGRRAIRNRRYARSAIRPRGGALSIGPAVTEVTDVFFSIGDV